MTQSSRVRFIASCCIALFVATPLLCRAGDLSTPLAALKTVGEAMQKGDAEAVKQASINVKPQVIDSICDMVKSTGTLHDAAVAKFGQEGDSIGQDASKQFAAQIANAKVDETGDTAVVTPTTGTPVTMQKTDGMWKLDFAKAKGMDSLESSLPLMNKMSGVNKELADDITAGKFASAAEAKAAVGKRMVAAMMPKASTQPAATDAPPEK